MIGYLRALRGVLTTAFVTVAMALSMMVATPTAGAATVLTISPLPHRMGPALQGSMCASPNTCNKIRYSWALNVAIDRLTKAIADYTSRVTLSTVGSAAPEDDRVTIFALSGGAAGVAKWMERHAANADAPSPEVLSFVLIGNPTRKYGGANRGFETMPQTQYQVIDIARQYDPIADAPDRFSLLAQLNVMLGILSPLHVDYSAVDLDAPENFRWTDGNTTYILVPTEDLPLLAPLRALGLRSLADRLNGPLKEIIERAYDRPWETAPGEPSRSSQHARAVVQPNAEQGASARLAIPVRTRSAPDAAGRPIEKPLRQVVDQSADDATADSSDESLESLAAQVRETREDEQISEADTDGEQQQLRTPAVRRAENSDRTAARGKNRGADGDGNADD